MSHIVLEGPSKPRKTNAITAHAIRVKPLYILVLL